MSFNKSLIKYIKSLIINNKNYTINMINTFRNTKKTTKALNKDLSILKDYQEQISKILIFKKYFFLNSFKYCC